MPSPLPYVVRQIPFEDPYSCYRKLSGHGPSLLLDSARTHPETGQYSFFAFSPYRIFSARGNQITIQTPQGPPQISSGNPFLRLRPFLDRFRINRPPELPPFIGGAAGYLGYGLAPWLEKISFREKPAFPAHDLYLMFFDTFIVFDHFERTGKIIYFPSPEEMDGTPWDTLKKKGKDQTSEIQERIFGSGIESSDEFESARGNSPIISPEISRGQFEWMVEEALGYIGSGDIYQANLSQKFLIKDLLVAPIEIYRRLRELNPSPFSAYLDTGEHQLVSASPERLFSLRKGHLTTRPIAGTRPRGNTPEEEHHFIKELLTSEKERAEHLMLIDLERNDIGRVCDFGTIKVEEMMTVETYSHVHHLVSSISGRITKDATWLDTLSALFPGGTITGTPKIRSMEIIDALEPTRRGPYTGSIGYISHSGEMDWNIIIRTLFHSKGEGIIQTGAGIVADSLPAREYDETLRKAEALFRVIAAGGAGK